MNESKILCRKSLPYLLSFLGLVLASASSIGVIMAFPFSKFGNCWATPSLVVGAASLSFYSLHVLFRRYSKIGNTTSWSPPDAILGVLLPLALIGFGIMLFEIAFGYPGPGFQFFFLLGWVLTPFIIMWMKKAYTWDIVRLCCVQSIFSILLVVVTCTIPVLINHWGRVDLSELDRTLIQNLACLTLPIAIFIYFPALIGWTLGGKYPNSKN